MNAISFAGENNESIEDPCQYVPRDSKPMSGSIPRHFVISATWRAGPKKIILESRTSSSVVLVRLIAASRNQRNNKMIEA
jgi:hypothetical protein